VPTVLSLLIAVAILLPLVVSFGLSGLDSLGEAVSSPSFNGITLFTLRQAVLSTSLALLAGLPAAIYFSRSRSRISKLLGLTTYIPFFFPGISMAIGFLAIYGRNGLLNSTLALFGFERLQILYSFGAILLGHVFYNAPIVILILGNALKRIPSDLLEMARMDGAGKLTRFLKVELPLAVPALVNSALLIFSYCFTSFAVVLILGGAQFATLEVSIYMYFRLLGRPQMAVALSVIQFAFIMLFGVLISISERRIPFEQGEQYIEKKTVTRLYSMLFLVFEWVPILGAFASSFYDPPPALPRRVAANRYLTGKNRLQFSIAIDGRVGHDRGGHFLSCMDGQEDPWGGQAAEDSLSPGSLGYAFHDGHFLSHHVRLSPRSFFDAAVILSGGASRFVELYQRSGAERRAGLSGSGHPRRSIEGGETQIYDSPVFQKHAVLCRNGRFRDFDGRIRRLFDSRRTGLPHFCGRHI